MIVYSSFTFFITNTQELFATGSEAEKSFILQSAGTLVARINPTGETKKRQYAQWRRL